MALLESGLLSGPAPAPIQQRRRGTRRQGGERGRSGTCACARGYRATLVLESRRGKNRRGPPEAGDSMSEIREGLVEVIGASIHYQVSGHGPTLLLLSPGDGDADVFSDLVPLLDGFTVVTCDRRGQARSAIVDPGEPITIATHADDMARVLVAVT